MSVRLGDAAPIEAAYLAPIVRCMFPHYYDSGELVGPATFKTVDDFWWDWEHDQITDQELLQAMKHPFDWHRDQMTHRRISSNSMCKLDEVIEIGGTKKIRQ